MSRRVTARSYANIAFIKYWGKADAASNSPATPSISLAIDCLSTTTTVEQTTAGTDRLKINGKRPAIEVLRRLTQYIDVWRNKGIVAGKFNVTSVNNFPTAAGLASSSSGFAALATALAEHSSQNLSRTLVSRLARLGSGSAARSVTGGLSALPIGRDPSARMLRAADHVPFGVIVAICEETAKSIGSREGMNLSKRSSPYFDAWVKQSQRDYKAMMSAIKRNDFTAIGTLAEENACAMHACMIATRPQLIYWNDITVRLIQKTRDLRANGVAAYFTVDAGPNVVFICRLDDLGRVARSVRRVTGVKNVLAGRPAGGSEVIS
jgi:diphosphomevalonate decarboxylase